MANDDGLHIGKEQFLELSIKEQNLLLFQNQVSLTTYVRNSFPKVERDAKQAKWVSTTMVALFAAVLTKLVGLWK